MKKTNTLIIGLLFALTACVGQITNNVDADTKIEGTANIDTKIDSKIDSNVKTGDLTANTGDTNNTTPVIKSVLLIIASPSSISMKQGDSTQLAGTVKFNDGSSSGEIIWSSLNTSIAQVDSRGKVIGIAKGTTNIIATSKDDASKNSSVTVTVSALTVSSPIPAVTPTPTPLVSPSPTITPIPTPTATATFNPDLGGGGGSDDDDGISGPTSTFPTPSPSPTYLPYFNGGGGGDSDGISGPTPIFKVEVKFDGIVGYAKIDNGPLQRTPLSLELKGGEHHFFIFDAINEGCKYDQTLMINKHTVIDLKRVEICQGG